MGGKRAVIWAAVSSKSQAKEEKAPLPDQLAKRGQWIWFIPLIVTLIAFSIGCILMVVNPVY